MAADDTRVRAAAAVGARDSRPARASPARSVCDRPCGLEAAGWLLRALAPPKSEGTGYCANIAGKVVASDCRRRVDVRTAPGFQSGGTGGTLHATDGFHDNLRGCRAVAQQGAPLRSRAMRARWTTPSPAIGPSNLRTRRCRRSVAVARTATATATRRGGRRGEKARGRGLAYRWRSDALVFA